MGEASSVCLVDALHICPLGDGDDDYDDGDDGYDADGSDGVGDGDGEPYLIFVIFFARAKFLDNRINTEKRQFFALNL